MTRQLSRAKNSNRENMMRRGGGLLIETDRAKLEAGEQRER